MKKAVLTALLAAVCIIFFALYTVSAEQNSGSWLYELTSEGLVITGFEGTDSDVVIPDEIDGYKVSVIGSHAFADNHTMKTLVIPEGITSIRGEAFYGCSGLSRIEFNARNCTVPDVWIYDSSKGAGVFSGAGLSSSDGLTVVFGDKVTKIPDHLFDTASTDEYGHNGYPFACVTAVELSDGVKEIGGYAFQSCEALEMVSFGTNVKSVGDFAFSECTALSSLTFSDALVSIGNGAFLGDTALERIEWGGGLESIGSSAFCDCSSLEELFLPDPLATIGSQAFSGCTALKQLSLPASLVSLQAEAFGGCIKLSRIEINSTNLKVPEVWIYDAGKGGGVFYGAGSGSVSGLKVFFGEEVTKVPDSIFDTASTEDYGRNDYPYAFVTEVELPESVVELGACSFRSCQNLETVRFYGRDAVFGEDAFAGCIASEFHFECIAGGTVEQYAKGEGISCAELDAEEDESVPAEAADSVSETWTCINGHAGNAGKYCTECGARRQYSSCPNCGEEFPDGAKYRFCPSCGQALE